MNRQQKIAWYSLAIITVSLMLCGITVGILAAIFGMQVAYSGLAFLGILGFLGLEPFLFRPKRANTSVNFDERDLLINRKAVIGAFTISYLYFVMVCMITWFVLGFKGTISVNALPLMVTGGYIVSQIVYSIMILKQYGWGIKGETL